MFGIDVIREIGLHLQPSAPPNLPLRELLDELENIAPIRCSVNQGVVTIGRR